MRKILVPTDFSTCANNAVDFAVHSAKMLPAEIILLHAFEVKGNIYTDYMGINKEFNQSLLDDMRQKLQDLKKNIEEAEEVKVTTELVKGTVKDVVAEAAVNNNADLIVMGTLGASGLKEKIWGSKTASIIGSTYIPVMAIPYEYSWKKPEKFLIATNHFEKEPAILDYVFELADLYMAQVQVAVFTDEEDDKAVTFLEHTRKIPQYEKMLKEQYKEETLTATHLYGTEFEETLHKYMNKQETDILVMITYQKEDGLWNRIFKPSKTKKMSYHTTIPLLAIPAK
ncbi:MAG TPA: universal stress protein [Chitinophagaceae bacterium]|nr:universal stress protein [Chitinophagaceae bacterium]